MKPLSFLLLQTFEPRAAAVRAALAMVFLVFALNAAAQERSTRQATDAEVTAGADVKAYINPLQFKNGGGGGGGGSNGITQLDYQHGIQSGTNIFRGSNVSVLQAFTSSLVVTNGMTNLLWTALTDLEADANKKAVSLPNAVGMKTNDGAGHVGYTLILPAGTDLSLATNLLNLAKLTSGANITLTPTKDPVTGATNWLIAVSDPASFTQVNAGTLTATNFVTTTNTMGGTAIDFSNSESESNMVGDVVLSSVANLTSGVYNRKVMHFFNNTGSSHTVTIATGWGKGTNDTDTVPTGMSMDALAWVHPGVKTNVFRKIIPVN